MIGSSRSLSEWEELYVQGRARSYKVSRRRGETKMMYEGGEMEGLPADQ